MHIKDQILEPENYVIYKYIKDKDTDEGVMISLYIKSQLPLFLKINASSFLKCLWTSEDNCCCTNYI